MRRVIGHLPQTSAETLTRPAAWFDNFGMSELTLKIPDEILATLAQSPADAGDELRMLAAVKLFELKKASSGAAAQLAGISRVEFLRRLADYGVPAFDMTDEEFARETRLG